MNKPPIRLGPLAILLLVVAIAMSTLSILTFTTARADMVLAQRYADSIKIRYELEDEGHKVLSEIASGKLPSEMVEEENMNTVKLEKEGYYLIIGLEKGTNKVVKWQLRKQWDHSENIDNLWPGE